MTERKSLTVHYRRLEDPTNAFGGSTIEQKIRAALADRIGGTPIKNDWSLRSYQMPPDNSDTYLMNIYNERGGCFFADLTVYTAGYLQALIKDEPNVAMLSVQQSPPPVDHEYVHSIMYWMAIENHVFIIQSRSLSTKHLELYLTWLLKERTNNILPNGQVILTAKFDSAQVGGDLDDIKEIVVGGSGVAHQPPARLPLDDVEGKEISKHVEVSEKRTWGERAKDILRAVMNSEADVQKLLDGIPEEADLDVSVKIGYKSKKRAVNRAPMMQALRNLPDGEITARGKYGRMSKNDIRLSYNVRVLQTGSLINHDDARAKMLEAYNHFVENGKIDT